MSDGKYITFTNERLSATGKTKIWDIIAKDGGDKLGEVRWLGSWRCYSHFITIEMMKELIKTNSELVFEKQCQRDIANFCEEQTNQQKVKRNA